MFTGGARAAGRKSALSCVRGRERTDRRGRAVADMRSGCQGRQFNDCVTAGSHRIVVQLSKGCHVGECRHQRNLYVVQPSEER